MPTAKRQIARNEQDGRFVVDGSYMRREAREAIASFVAPLSGVYRAVTGGDGVVRPRNLGQFSESLKK